jgi:RND family efflux transporter MFP subunit
MRRWGLILGLIAVALGVFWWQRSGSKPPEVIVAQAKRGVLTTPYSAEGVVKGWQASLSLPAPAQVVEVLVREGARVHMGQPLIRFWEQDLLSQMQAADARRQAALNALREAEQTYRQARAQIQAQIRRAEMLVKEAQAQLRLVQSGARSEEIEQAREEVAAAQAAFELAQRNADRAERLYQQGALPRADYERAQQEQRVAQARLKAAQARLAQIQRGARPEELEAARARVETARAELQLARSQQESLKALQERVQIARAALREADAALQGARRARELRTLAAPRNCVVVRINAEPGESVAPGIPAIELVDPQSLWIEAELAQEDAAKANPGDTVQVSAPALPGRRWEGRIVSILPAMERKPDSPLSVRILRAVVRLRQPPPELRPGMEVSVDGEGRLGKPTLLVPSDAVIEEPNRASVWVVQNGVAHQRTVKIGYFTYQYTEITDGLHEGEWVVVRGKENLKEGVRVRVKAE